MTGQNPPYCIVQRLKMGEKAKKIVEKYFTVNRFVDNTEKILKNIVNIKK